MPVVPVSGSNIDSTFINKNQAFRRLGADVLVISAEVPVPAILSALAASRTSHAHEATHAAALVDGFQLAFTVSAGLIIAGVVLAAVLLRRRDLARIDATQPVMVGA